MSMARKKPAVISDYAELQAISNFSFLRGGSHPHELVAQAKTLGLAGLAIADRNTVAGLVRAHVAAKELGLRFIPGARLELQDAPSLLCFPTDRAAWGRLCRLLSLGQGRAEKGQCTLFLSDVALYAKDQIFIALPPEEWDWREMEHGAEVARDARQEDNDIRTQGERGAAILRFPFKQGDPLSQRAELEGSSLSASGCASLRVWRLPLNPTSGPSLSTRGEEKGERARRGATAEASKEAARDDRQRETLASMLRRIKAAVGDAPLYLAASHTYRGEDRARIAALAELARRCGTPLIATGDVLYHAAHRRPLQDVLTCVREHCTIAEAGFRLAANAERHIKAPREMARLFAGHEDALARTIEIMQACRFSLDHLEYEYPDEPVPAGKTPQGHLEDLTWEGARRRFPEGIPPKVAALLKKELALIAELNYAHYFLTVHDIVHYAHNHNILAQGRGSAANSAVCYCLDITAVNPTEIDLLFERFISPERREPPDIDVDFEHEKREEVIQYIYDRYGRDRAGIAATVISYRARSAVREVGKAMGLSEDTVAALAGMVWGIDSNGALPDERVREAGLDPADPLLRTVLELTEELVGFPRHLSQHVGGFVLTRGPLIEVVPVGNAAMEKRTFVEWDKDDLAALNLLKVDVLALGMLTCIHRAFDLLALHHGRHLTLASVPRDDPKVYDMLCKADSIGVFQVESRAQMNMLPRLKPRTFYDLVIEVAIVRPGPIQGDMVHPYLRRRSGLEPEIYPSPAPEHGDRHELQQILGKTKGVPLFQEQAMRIAMVAAKFSDAEVNDLRKAMATFRRRGTIGLLEEKMVSRMAARGYDLEFARRCFSQIQGFGEYGFPESHAASFALLVYVSSWIKCHYPAVFAAALLNSQPMGFYAPAQIVRDAREHGVEVRPADVNHSDWDCTLEPGGADGGPALRLGLRQIDGLQEEEVKKIVLAREGVRRDAPSQAANSSPLPLRGERAGAERGSPFRDMHDVWLRAGVRLATLERLAAADAFRSIGLDRRQALWEMKALAAAEPLPLFAWGEAREAGPEPHVALPAMPLSEHVVNDYQTLRLSLKAHPMSFLRVRLAAARIRTCADLRKMRDGAWVAVAGVVLVRQRPGSAQGVVFMTIEDETGIANAVVWPKTLEKFRRAIMGGRLLVVRGRVQRHEDIIHVVSARIEDRSDWLLELMDDGAEPMRIPIANADEVRRPDPGSARSPVHPRWAGHPRNERIIPKSRDFH
ncbi:MAG: error-prone DNA polymerase [Bacteroidota bacterium]